MALPASGYALNHDEGEAIWLLGSRMTVEADSPGRRTPAERHLYRILLPADAECSTAAPACKVQPCS